MYSKLAMRFIWVFVFTFIVSGVTSNQLAHANESMIVQTSLDSNGSKVIDLQSGVQLSVRNRDSESETAIIKKDLKIYEKSIPLGYAEKVHIWNYRGDQYTAIEYRLAGTSAVLLFDLFVIEGEEVKLIFSSQEYTHGKFKLEGKDSFKVTFPTYERGDTNAFPSNLATNSFLINENNNVTLKNETENEYNSFSTKGTGQYSNPAPELINKMLTDAAKANNIPPEIFKAIVWQESGWRQFTSDGNPLIGYDGRGLGITQVTYSRSYLDENPGLEEKLKTDIQFNINEGIKILKQKWNTTYVPWINDHSPEEIEHWYFAILAYNGYAKKNDPRLTAEERTELGYLDEAYQDSIYKHMRGDMGQLNVTSFPVHLLNINYASPTATLMDFSSKKQYDISGPFTTTKHLFVPGDVVATRAEVKLRSSATSQSAEKRSMLRGESVKITGGIRYASNKLQHFGWYPVKTQEGNVGYIASSYLTEPENILSAFPDLRAGVRGYPEVATLVENEVISGFPDSTFRPDVNLTRTQAAIMFANALDLDTANLTDPGFKDVAKSYRFYPQIAAVQEAGIFLGDGKGNFNGNQELTRGEMAAALVRAYDLTNRKETPFTDVGGVFKPSIEIIYSYNITNGISETKYGTNEKISRRDFSIFLFRTIVKAPN
ncbi:S-layer homology domain-containing protein [Fictibacillus phosphorivorans]|uniref:S-layer homology domain-containing protein n=1 Tax=Fictibacillus phosphorivorans TaxID=1221500 RepID=UPI003CFB3049